MELHLAPVFERVFRGHHRARRMVEPVIEAGQQEAQGAAACQYRDRRQFLSGQGADLVVFAQEPPGLGHIEG